MMLGRQLEAQMAEFTGTSSKKGDHRAMVRSANTILTVRRLLYAFKPGEEGYGLERVNVITTLRADLMLPFERSLISKAQQTVREFSMSSLLASNTQTPASQGPAATFAQIEETKSRAISALTTLYLLSPTTPKTISTSFDPSLLITSLQEYLQTALKSSLASMTRSLATLPTLDRTLLEISARCQNILALESLLESIKPPSHPLFDSDTALENSANANRPPNFLRPLLQSLDTSSLPSYFWRTLASNLNPRVQDIMQRGGVSARTLRSNRDRVRDALRHCVDRGSQVPRTGLGGKGQGDKALGWEREAAVMVSAVVGVLR